MPRNLLRVPKNPKKDGFHQGNFNQLLDRVDSPTVNASLRLLRGANKKDGILCSLFPARNKRSRTDSTSQHPRHSLNKKNGIIDTSDDPGCQDLSEYNIPKKPNIDDEAILKEMLDAIQMEVMENVQSEKTTKIPKPNKKRKWSTNISRYEELWEKDYGALFDACISSGAVNISFCMHCSIQIFNVIRCNCCNQHLCEQCDRKFHFDHPFHIRVQLQGLEAVPLKPTEFIIDGEKKDKEVPIPCFVPVQCPHCNLFNELKRKAGTNRMKVVTEQGRFDLYCTSFICSSCGKSTEASIKDYMQSGFWPGYPSKDCSYLFSTTVLSFWHRLKNNTPGTSLLKYVETLKNISKSFGRKDTINEVLFNLASQHYEHFVRHCEKYVLKRKHDGCYSCGSDPLACHCDGNRKIYRYNIDSQATDKKPLLQQLVDIFPDDKEIVEFVKTVDAVHPRKGKEKESCGNALYKAGRADSYRVKNQDETGLIMCSCRHGVIFKALDMYEGENYRLVLWMLKISHKLGYKIFCYDVVCNFVRFLKNLVVKAPEYKYLLDEITFFLSRMHGKTHEWVCQLEHSGHWKKDAGLTTGEMQEQSNAYMSRLGNVTKHMGKASRRDHLISAILDWNRRKEDNMADSLCRSLLMAKNLEVRYKREFESLLGNRKESNMQDLADELLNEGKSYKGSRRLNQMPQTTLEDELEGIHWHIQVLQERIKNGKDGSKARNALRNKVTILKSRGKKVVALLNDVQKIYRVNEDVIHSGKFPWQPLQQSVPFYQRYQLVDSWMLFNRSKEEINQVKKEMKQYIASLMSIHKEIRENIQNIIAEDLPFPTKENPFLTCSEDNLLKRGKVAAAKKEMLDLSTKILETISFFKHYLDSPLEELQEALEDDGEEVAEAIWNEVEEELAALDLHDKDYNEEELIKL